MNETAHDYRARLNIEGSGDVWRENRRKIDYVLWKTRKYLKRGLTACDIGIGDGYLLTRLNGAGLKVTGIDISGYSIGYLRDDFRNKGLDIGLIEGDISNVRLQENQFDIVTCFDVLEHIPGENLSRVLEQLKKSMVPGGLLIGTLPFQEDLSRNMLMCPECGHRFHRVGHFHSFQTAEEITTLFEPDFTILEMGEFRPGFFRSAGLASAVRLLRLIKRLVRKGLHKKKKRKMTVYFVAGLAKLQD